MFKRSSLILAVSALLASSTTVFANDTGNDVFERLVNEIESTQQAPCEGEDYVRCVDYLGNVFELTFTQVAEDEYDFDVKYNNQEVQDLSQFGLSPELLAEIGDQDEADALALVDEGDDIRPANEDDIAKNQKQQTKPQQQQKKAPAEKSPRAKKLKVRKPHETTGERMPRTSKRGLGCPTGPKNRTRHVKIRHARSAKPSNNSKKVF